MLPDKSITYLCLLCEPSSREVFLCEILVKSHLASHSSFFLKKWERFVEFRCRICESAINKEDLEGHFNEFHSCKLFDSCMDNKMMNSKSPTSKEIEQFSFERKSKCLSITLPALSRQAASPPASSQVEDLWDQCFKPEHLINRYFGSLAVSRPKTSQHSPPRVSEKMNHSKPRIRVKPLSLLLVQSQLPCNSPPVSPPLIQHAGSTRQSSSPPPPVCLGIEAEEAEEAENEISLEDVQPKSIISPGLPAWEVPQARTWLHRSPVRNSDTKMCIICGMEVLRRMLPNHIQYLHQDMLFSCRVGSCRRARQKGLSDWSSFLYPNQLSRHHQVQHKTSTSFWSLDLSQNLTGLPTSLVRISCSMCDMFLLGPKTTELGEHIRSVHGGGKAVMKYNCRLCNLKSSSVEDVIRHSMSHRSQGESVKDTEMDEQESDFTRKGIEKFSHSPKYSGERESLPRSRNSSPHREMSSSRSVSSRSSISKDNYLGKKSKDSLGRRGQPPLRMRTNRRECTRREKRSSNRKRTRSPTRSLSNEVRHSRRKKRLESSESETRFVKVRTKRSSQNRRSRTGTHSKDRSRSSSRGSSRWDRRSSPRKSSQFYKKYRRHEKS